MNNHLYIFIIVLTSLFFSQESFGQAVSGSTREIKGLSQIPNPVDSLQYPFCFSLPVLSGDLYERRLTFFCRQEWKLEKSIRIPLRIRVGSLDQCNFLEGK